MNRSARYFPGTGYLVLGPALAALTGDATLAERLWPLIAHNAGGSAVLEAALQDGLHELSDLLVVEFDDRRTRVFARGSHIARVTIADGDVVVCEGKDVISWAESVFDDAQAGWVDIESGEGFPIIGGIVRADGFRWESDSVVPFRQEPGTEWQLGAELSSPPIIRTDAPASDDPGRSWVSVTKDVAAANVAAVAEVDAGEERPVDEWSSGGGDARADATVDEDPAPTAVGYPEIPASAVPRTGPVPQAPPVPPPSLTAEPISAPPVSTAKDQPPPRPVRSLSETRTDTTDEGYDHLFEATVYRNVEEAAVRDVVENAVATASSIETADSVGPQSAAVPSALGDHDGSTIMASELAALRQEVVSAGEVTTPQSAAVLILVTGEQISLDRGVVIGRRPQIDRVAGTAIPTLVTVPSPQQDISRSHVQIDVTGHGFTVTDLHSVNGTVLIKANGVASSIAAGRPYPLQFGDQLDIGDGMTMTLRGAP